VHRRPSRAHEQEKRVEQQRVAKLARLRAVAAYKGGAPIIDDLVGGDANVMDAGRRATMLDRVNARGNEAIDQLAAITSDMHRRSTSLHHAVKRQENALHHLKERPLVHGQRHVHRRRHPARRGDQGSVSFQGDPLGGNAAYVNGNDGNTYYYAHLDDYVGGARVVRAGELIGQAGSSGNADGGAPHLHFEIRAGGPNGRQIDPYPTLTAHC
jgi:septal ring factor EnvC (AmiA/AmiB activator)